MSDAPANVMGWQQAPNPGPASLYERDEHAWLHKQAELLRTGRFAEIDCASLAEFLTDMARRDERELRSRLVILLQHLLKAEYQPEKLSDSWVDTIDVQQVELREILESAALRAKAPGIMGKAWPLARRQAIRGTKLPDRTFPRDSPWTVEQALSYVPLEPQPHPADPDHP